MMKLIKAAFVPFLPCDNASRVQLFGREESMEEENVTADAAERLRTHRRLIDSCRCLLHPSSSFEQFLTAVTEQPPIERRGTTDFVLFLDSFLQYVTRPYELSLCPCKPTDREVDVTACELKRLVFMILSRFVNVEEIRTLDVGAFERIAAGNRLCLKGINLVAKQSGIEEAYATLLARIGLFKSTQLVDIAAIYCPQNCDTIHRYFFEPLSQIILIRSINSQYLLIAQMLNQATRNLLNPISPSTPLEKIIDVQAYLLDLSHSIYSISSVMPQIVESFTSQRDEWDDVFEPDSMIHSLISVYEAVIPVLDRHLEGQFEASELAVSLYAPRIRKTILMVFSIWLDRCFGAATRSQDTTCEDLLKVIAQATQVTQDEARAEVGSFMGDFLEIESFQTKLFQYFPTEQIDSTSLDYLSLMRENLPKRVCVDASKKVYAEKKSVPRHGIHEESLPGDDDSMELLISQVMDLFPDLGAGFVEQCLLALESNAENVINALLEGSLPKDLASLDKTMDRKQAKDMFVSQVSAQVEHKEMDTKIAVAPFRDNIYNGDEFDTAKYLDPSRVWVGKKRQPAKYKVDSVREDIKFADKQRNILLSYDFETPLSSYNEYDDDYNDEFDDYTPFGVNDNNDVEDYESIKAQNTIVRAQEAEDKFWEDMRNPNHLPKSAPSSSDNEKQQDQSEGNENAQVKTPATKQSINSLPRASKELTPAQELIKRARKNKNKAHTGNHDRKTLALKKASRT